MFSHWASQGAKDPGVPTRRVRGLEGGLVAQTVLLVLGVGQCLWLLIPSSGRPGNEQDGLGPELSSCLLQRKKIRWGGAQGDLINPTGQGGQATCAGPVTL